MKVPPGTSGLGSLVSNRTTSDFNLGYGRYLTDSIRGLQIVTVTEPWLKPAWILVDYKLSLLDLNSRFNEQWSDKVIIASMVQSWLLEI
jgi:hypothetical protein